jgi:serine/threonine protein kinase
MQDSLELQHCAVSAAHASLRPIFDTQCSAFSRATAHPGFARLYICLLQSMLISDMHLIVTTALSHSRPTHASSAFQVKICDFGLAKYSSTSLATKQSQYTSGSVSNRTLEYSSPERLRRGRRSNQDDVYAFGVLLYVIATSRSPYSGIRTEDVQRIVEQGERPDIEEWEEGGDHGAALQERVVAPYCQLARQCWDQNPAARPSFEGIYARLDALAASAGAR